MKKICSFLLALMLFVGFVTSTVSAETYTVTIDINGGKNVLGLDSVWELPPQEQKLIPVPSIYVAPPAGKELDAYEINGVRYEINSVYNLTSDITIKALWKTKGTQVMVMDLNGGTSEGVSPYVEYKKNDKITLNFVAENNITPPKGKTFDAYEIDGIRYEAGSTYTVTKTFTVKVLWKDAALYGDLDGNDAINASDALLVLQISVNKVVPTDLQRIAADVNGDGVISAPDALLILQHSVAKIAKFPIEK